MNITGADKELTVKSYNIDKFKFGEVIANKFTDSCGIRHIYLVVRSFNNHKALIDLTDKIIIDEKDAKNKEFVYTDSELVIHSIG